MKKMLLVCAVILITLGNYRSYSQPVEDKFGKVSMDEMNMNICSIDSSANALVLFDIGSTTMNFDQSNKDFQLVFTRHMRIKIFNKQGIDFGNVEISLYNKGNNSEKIYQFKGYTYNLVNGKVEKTKASDDNFFVEKKSDNITIHKLAFPKVEAGSVVEFKYSITSGFIFNLQPWYFQKRVPVLWSSYTTMIPDYFFYNNHVSGYEKVNVLEKEPRRGSFRYTWEEEETFGQKQKYYKDYEYFEKITEYTAQNVPSIKDEPFIDNIDNYTSSVVFELASVKIPGQVYKNYSTSWEDVSKELVKDDRFGMQLSVDGHLKDEILALVGSVEKPEEKILAVREYIQKRIKWNQNFGIFTEKGVKQAFKNGVGNVGDINLNLIIALRLAGLEVFPVILSTRSHGRVFDWKREINGFNYVLAAVYIDNKTILCDAVSEHSLSGLVPIMCLNGQALLIDSNRKGWVDVNPKTNSKKTTLVNYKIEGLDKVVGTVECSYKDYYAQSLVGSLSSSDSKDTRKTSLEKEYSNATVDSLKYDISAKGQPEIKERYNLTLDISQNYAGSMVYLSPLQGFGLTSNPFTSSERKLPVNFSYPREETAIIKFNLPENLTIEELPKNLSMSMPGGVAKYAFSCQQVGSEIVVSSRFVLSKIEYLTTEYSALRGFFDEVLKKQLERIVLKKL